MTRTFLVDSEHMCVILWAAELRFYMDLAKERIYNAMWVVYVACYWFLFPTPSNSNNNTTHDLRKRLSMVVR